MERLTIDNVRGQVVGIDTKVPLLDGRTVPYINLDNAATTPTLKPVFDKVNEFLRWYSSVERGSGFKSRLSTEIYEEARRIAGGFVEADPESYTVIFTKNATEAINKLAHRFPFSQPEVFR